MSFRKRGEGEQPTMKKSASARARTTTHSVPSPIEEASKHAGEDKFWQ
jgi:hypothetical protein